MRLATPPTFRSHTPGGENSSLRTRPVPHETLRIQRNSVQDGPGADSCYRRSNLDRGFGQFSSCSIGGFSITPIGTIKVSLIKIRDIFEHSMMSSKGPSINDVVKLFKIFDPPLPLSAYHPQIV